MVSAELEHNPFLLETRVLFNGVEPRVNSAVEKRAHQALSEWVGETPRIFHDEMNGYDFDLFFSGTESDFEDVRRAFESAGVGEEAVRIFHKGNLKGALEKWEAAISIIDWLKGNPNRQFDFEGFVRRHPDLVDCAFPLVLLHASTSQDTLPLMRVEPIDDVEALEGTDLDETPIVIFVSPESIDRIRGDVSYLMARGDVSQSQVYFVIHPLLDSARITRILTDLGIGNPGIISRVDDPSIGKYVQNHPVTSYVRYAIAAFSEEAAAIGEKLEALSQESMLTSANERSRIESVEREIDQLKGAEEYFTHLPNLGESEWFGRARWSFVEGLSKWRSRKTKVQGEGEVRAAAAEYAGVVERGFSEFAASIDKTLDIEMRRIGREFRAAYAEAGVDSAYSPDWIEPQLEADPPLPDIRRELMQLKRVDRVEPRNDIFNLFNPADASGADRVEVTFCYIDKWRDRALELTSPLLDAMISVRLGALAAFHVQLAGRYEDHVGFLIEQRLAAKSAMTDRLSGEERMLQEDFDWLTAFKDQLQELERG